MLTHAEPMILWAGSDLTEKAQTTEHYKYSNGTVNHAASGALIPLLGLYLYAKGRVLGFKRAKRNQRPDISLVQIEGVKTAADTEFYLGKRIAFVYRAKREVNGSKIRCIWGRITRAHGGSGAVKARFRNNLPAKSFGASVRVMMYPSRV
ncbi:60S ribosomal protein L33A [Mortierella alpina]|nr:60S ribosomal protein L33A [Mortierella alpina]